MTPPAPALSPTQRVTLLMLTALAPALWGTTYIVTTQILSQFGPWTLAMLRALLAGLILLAIVRALPPRAWLGRLLVVAACNFSVFWVLLFVAAQRLPGGVAATLGAVQPLFVLGLSVVALRTPWSSRAAMLAGVGMVGVACMVLRPSAALDTTGVAAALGGALSMALGTVLTKRWQPPGTTLQYTAWQLTLGGLMLLPLALVFEPQLPPVGLQAAAGMLWLSVVGAALTYLLWFRGIRVLGPAAVTMLGFLSPLTAVLLGWMVLGQRFSATQALGAGLVLISVWLNSTLSTKGGHRQVAS